MLPPALLPQSKLGELSEQSVGNLYVRAILSLSIWILVIPHKNILFCVLLWHVSFWLPSQYIL